ncbi:MAG: hypothetical protein ACE5IR_21345 [bacterium]
MNTLKELVSVLVTLSALVLFACSSNRNSSPTSTDSRGTRLYLQAVESGDAFSSQDNVELTVKGNLPSPAYTFQRFEVDVQGKVIKITPLVDHDSSTMVAQVLVPFQQVCNVGKLKPGTYEIQIAGRRKSIQKSIEVK